MSKFSGEQLLFSLSVGLTFCNHMDFSTPGFPVPHYLPQFAQTHVHWADDAIQPSHPPSPLLLLPSIFLSIRVFFNELASLHQMAKFLEFQLPASVLSMNSQSLFPLGLTGLISLLSKLFSRVFSSITAWKHQFFSTKPSLWYNSRIHTWLLEKP